MHCRTVNLSRATKTFVRLRGLKHGCPLLTFIQFLSVYFWSPVIANYVSPCTVRVLLACSASLVRDSAIFQPVASSAIFVLKKATEHVQHSLENRRDVIRMILYTWNKWDKVLLNFAPSLIIKTFFNIVSMFYFKCFQTLSNHHPERFWFSFERWPSFINEFHDTGEQPATHQHLSLSSLE